VPSCVTFIQQFTVRVSGCVESGTDRLNNHVNKYEKLMQEIVEYLDGTWLASWNGNPAIQHRGPIRGNSEDEIEAVEQKIGRKLPSSMKAWYRRAGAVPPYLYDYDADHSLQDFQRAQKTARELTQDENCKWKLTDTIFPFSQRIGEQFNFVNTQDSNPDDPPVFHYMETHAQPSQVDIAFTIYIREIWLEWLDASAANQEIIREMSTRHDKKVWLARKHVLEALDAEVREFRRQLLEVVHQEDLGRNLITSPRVFQERWLQEFPKSEIWDKLQKEGLRMPFNWIDPPKASSKP
jgi:hypothetical protein